MSDETTSTGNVPSKQPFKEHCLKCEEVGHGTTEVKSAETKLGYKGWFAGWRDQPEVGDLAVEVN